MKIQIQVVKVHTACNFASSIPGISKVRGFLFSQQFRIPVLKAQNIQVLINYDPAFLTGSFKKGDL